MEDHEAAFRLDFLCCIWVLDFRSPLTDRGLQLSILVVGLMLPDSSRAREPVSSQGLPASTPGAFHALFSLLIPDMEARPEKIRIHVCIPYLFSIVLVMLGLQRHLLIIFCDNLFSEGE